VLGQPTQTQLASFEEIPVVDISGANDPARRPDLVKQVVSTAEQIRQEILTAHLNIRRDLNPQPVPPAPPARPSAPCGHESTGAVVCCARP